MSVCVKSMHLPPSCYFCPMTNDGFYLCKANNPYKHLEDDCEERKPDWCPLIKVPESHGRLIDADALCKTLRSLAENEYSPEVFANWIENHIDTIIPASEEGE